MREDVFGIRDVAWIKSLVSADEFCPPNFLHINGQYSYHGVSPVKTFSQNKSSRHVAHTPCISRSVSLPIAHAIVTSNALRAWQR